MKIVCEDKGDSLLVKIKRKGDANFVGLEALNLEEKIRLINIFGLSTIILRGYIIEQLEHENNRTD